MTVVEVDRDRALAGCRADGTSTVRTVDVMLLAETEPGDRLLVHAGTALERVGHVREVRDEVRR